MFVPYGIIDLAVAVDLDLAHEEDYIELGMQNGVCAIVDERNFMQVFNAMRNVSGDGLCVIVDSDIVGMKTILCQFWSNFENLNSATSGATKATATYRHIMGLSANDRWGDDIKQAVHRQLWPENTVEAQRDTLEPVIEADTIIETDNTPLPPEDSRLAELNRSIDSYISRHLDAAVYKGKKWNVIILDNEGETIALPDGLIKDLLIKLAESIEKHIFITPKGMKLQTISQEFFYDNACSEIAVLLCFASKYGNMESKFFYTPVSISQYLFGVAVPSMYAVRSSDSAKSAYSEYDRVYKDTFTNTVFAVQSAHIVYFLISWDNFSETIAEAIFSRFAKRYTKEISYDEMLLSDAESSLMITDNNAKNFADRSTSNAETIIKKMIKDHKDALNTYNEALEGLMQSSVLLRQKEMLISCIDEKKIEDGAKKRAIESYIEASKIEKVKSIYISGDNVHVFTKNLYAKDPRSGKWHDIGTFHFQLNMGGSSYSSTCLNIANTKHSINGLNKGMQAPHVFANGHACHGNLDSAIAESYRTGDLYGCVLMIIIFLESVNVDDGAGKYIDRWPVVSEEVATGKITDDGEVAKKVASYDDELVIPVHI